METAIYTSDVPRDLLCFVCSLPPVQPRFCASCWRLSCAACPSDTCCRGTPDNGPHGIGPLGDRLASLPCSCPVEDCQWKGERRHYEKHYQMCRANLATCPFDCGVKVHLAHDRWHFLSCSGYRAYLDDLLDNDPVKAALAIKIERRLRVPFTIGSKPVQLPAVNARWKVMTSFWTGNNAPNCSPKTAEKYNVNDYNSIPYVHRKGRMCFYFYTTEGSSDESRLLSGGGEISFDTLTD